MGKEPKVEPRLIEDKTDQKLLDKVATLEIEIARQDKLRRQNDIWQSIATTAVLAIEGILIYNLYA